MQRIVIHKKGMWMPAGEWLREDEWVPEGEGRRGEEVHMVVQYIYTKNAKNIHP
jgi:hypothetical protein